MNILSRRNISKYSINDSPLKNLLESSVEKV
jgi:hypothetical protein